MWRGTDIASEKVVVLEGFVLGCWMVQNGLLVGRNRGNCGNRRHWTHVYVHHVRVHVHVDVHCHLLLSRRVVVGRQAKPVVRILTRMARSVHEPLWWHEIVPMYSLLLVPSSSRWVRFVRYVLQKVVKCNLLRLWFIMQFSWFGGFLVLNCAEIEVELFHLFCLMELGLINRFILMKIEQVVVEFFSWWGVLGRL